MGDGPNLRPSFEGRVSTRPPQDDAEFAELEIKGEKK
jgi:hypothetical protein